MANVLTQYETVLSSCFKCIKHNTDIIQKCSTREVITHHNHLEFTIEVQWFLCNTGLFKRISVNQSIFACDLHLRNLSPPIRPTIFPINFCGRFIFVKFISANYFLFLIFYNKEEIIEIA